jgi:UPF0176 protein
LDKTTNHFKPDGPVLVDGVRAYLKQGEENMNKAHAQSERIVVGKQGEVCEHEHQRRVRSLEVLGEPGEVLKEWARAGRELPSNPTL